MQLRGEVLVRLLVTKTSGAKVEKQIHVHGVLLTDAQAAAKAKDHILFHWRDVVDATPLKTFQDERGWADVPDATADH